MDATLCRLSAVNAELNAVVTVADGLMDRAAALDAAGARGPLHGLPLGIKDVTATAGLRTTFGSALFTDHVPTADATVVGRLKAAGGIVLGKTNTPEFATGGHTDNAVFGATRNPWDLSRTAGGSTGGGATALAAGLIAVAEGTDMGGSLRIPAAFCGVCGLRPRSGQVPDFDDLQVTGPMARTVADLALVFEVMAGRSLALDHGEHRLGWVGDLSGRGVARALADVGERVAREHGAIDAPLDLSAGCDAFLALRGSWMVRTHRHLLGDLDALGPALAGNLRQGLAVTEAQLAAADATRTSLRRAVEAVLDEVDALVTPAVAIPAFQIAAGVPTHIEGTPMESYIDWVAPTYLLTLTGLPVVAVPVGQVDGMPVGVQVVARTERTALAAAAQLEHTLRPPLTFPSPSDWLKRLPQAVFDRVLEDMNLPRHLATYGPVPRVVRVAELVNWLGGAKGGLDRLHERLDPSHSS
jgi:amidase